MVFVLYLIIALGFIAFVAGGLWVLKIAFGISAGWGLACLFFPPIFFARYWNECRLPFFINITGILLFLIGMMGFAGYTENAKVKELARVEWEDMDTVSNGEPALQPWWDETQGETDFSESKEFVDDGDHVDYGDNTGSENMDTVVEDPVEVDQEPIPAVMPTSVAAQILDPAENATPTPLPHWLKKWGRAISRDEYESYIGSRVQVHTADGQAFRVFLIQSNDYGIRVRERVGSGSMDFSLEHKVVVEVRAKN